MSYQFWSGVLTAVGLFGFFLAGKRVWWAWYINIANQVIWAIYSVITEQWPFLVGVVAYSIVFTKNAIAWTKEHQAKQRAIPGATKVINANEIQAGVIPANRIRRFKL